MEQRKREAAALLASEQAARRAANAKPGLSKPPAAKSNNKGNSIPSPPKSMTTVLSTNGSGMPIAFSSNEVGNGGSAPTVTKSKALTGKQKKPIKLGYREQQV